MSDQNYDPIYGIPYDPRNGSLEKDDQSAAHFSSMSEHFRIYLRSHIYASTSERIPRPLPIFDQASGRIISTVVTTPKCLERSYLEILSNSAADNSIKSRKQGIDPGMVTITMTHDTISIENEGAPFPLEPHPELTCPYGTYYGTVAQLVFSKVGSGSNLNAGYKRTTSGQNGTGSKFTNIHSTNTIIEIGDNRRGVYQRLQWKRNMVDLIDNTCTPPYVFQNGQWILGGHPYTGRNFVRYTWTQDFRKFACNSYSAEDLALYMRYAIDASYSNKIIVNFNGIVLDYRNVDKYAALFAPESVKTKILFYTFNTPPMCDKKDIPYYVETGQLVPDVEGFLLNKPDGGFHNSYCNGIVNVNGGVHTNEGYKSALNVIKSIILADKSYGLNEEEVGKIDIKMLKKHAILVINFRCDNPEVEGQDKHTLLKPTPKINISPDDVKNLKTWGVLDKIYEMINAKTRAAKSKKRIVTEKFKDANLVGRKGAVTVLLPFEGKSAGGYGDFFVACKDGGCDFYAVYPMKGKIKNVSSDTNKEMDTPERSGNPNELVKFMDTMGLVDGVDYCTAEGIESLRYKYAMVMVDADSDGTHILCLLINFLYRRFPSFLKAGRLMWILTPVIRAIDSKGGTIQRFYNICDYDFWVEHDGKNIKHRPDYFKGLASASEEQAKEDATFSPSVVIYFDEEAEIYLQIAFDQNSKSADKRKQWIMFYKDYVRNSILENDIVRISQLLNIKLTEYNLDTLPRSLVAYKDMQKDSQRKLAAYLIEDYKFGTSDKPSKKIVQISNAASEVFEYHHGDASLVATLARMGTDYPGSNNLPFVTKDGMLGSRAKLGKDCGAGRYVKCKPNWWIPFLVKKELYKMIPRVIVESKECEPKWIPYLLPLGIINGSSGIATGWSCYLTNHHPGDVGEWVLNYITGNHVFPMIPWFKGFTGNVYLEVKTVTEKKTVNELMYGNQETCETYGGLTCRTDGIYQIYNQRTKEVIVEIDDPEIAGKKRKIKETINICDLDIYEVPIGVEWNKLNVLLDSLSESSADKTPFPLITPCLKYVGYCGSIEPRDIGMISREGLSNISTVDDNGIPVTFKNIYQLMASYCDNIADLFLQLKKKQIIELSETIIDLAMEVSIILKSIRKELIFVGRNDDELKYEIENIPILLDYVVNPRIREILSNSKIPFKIFEGIGAKQFTEKNFNNLVKKLQEKQEELRLLEESNHLEKWRQYLVEFLDEIYKRPEYRKLAIHHYDRMYCPVSDLISGRIVSPFLPPIDMKVI